MPNMRVVQASRSGRHGSCAGPVTPKASVRAIASTHSTSALTAETSKRELMLDAELTAPFHEARLHRRDDVVGTVALHMTTVSR
jgi:hypothetical protein